MKKATYKLLDGSEIEVEYDSDAPCIHCGKPVVAVSMGGTVVCPWCDCGVDRSGNTVWIPPVHSPEVANA